MTHHYPVQVRWNGGKSGSGSVGLQQGATAVALAVPTEYQGTGAGTSPEELLASAVAGCYAVTFGIVAEHRKVPVVDLDVRATGEVEQEGPKLTYTTITIRPTIRLAAGATDDHAKQALDIAHRADKYCIITNAVRSAIAVHVEPEILRD